MDFLEQLPLWAKGDALQGRIMLAIGIVLLLASVFIFRGDNPILKGMLIPLCLLVIVNAGYGGFVSFSRPQHLVTVSENFAKDKNATLQKELTKAEKDNKAYSTLKPVWAVLIVIALGLYFFIDKDYVKGLSLGLMVLFVSLLVIDTLLHHRLQPYLEAIKTALN